MEFSRFTEYAGRIEELDGDLEKTSAVGELLAEVDDTGDTDLLHVVPRFIQGQVFAGWDTRKLDVGRNVVRAAVARAATDVQSADDVEDREVAAGELGDAVAEMSFGDQAGLSAFTGGNGGGDDTLHVLEVYETFEDIAATSGEGSASTVQNTLFGLFNRCSSQEAKFLARLLIGEMRISVGEGVVRDAAADTFDIPVSDLRDALQVTNDIGEVVVAAVQGGADAVRDMDMELGRPVKSMKAQAADDTAGVTEWGKAAVDFKFDGARAQVHYDAETDDITIYSRNMEDMTAALPEVCEFVRDHVDESVVLDGEVVAVDENGNPEPFQKVLTRIRRKDDVARMRQQNPVEYYPFDLLYREEPLLETPLRDRYEALCEVYPEDRVSDQYIVESVEEIAEIEATALEAGHEGAMVKRLDSAYTPGERGTDWLKRKPDVDTFDVVIVGAEWGTGRRGNLLGTFLLAVQSPDGFQAIGKMGTGLDDEELERLTERLEPHIIAEDGEEVEIEPNVVIEVGTEEIQESPTYESGYSLRFPRFRAIRDDVSLDDVDPVNKVETVRDSR